MYFDNFDLFLEEYLIVFVYFWFYCFWVNFVCFDDGRVVGLVSEVVIFKRVLRVEWIR